MAGVKKVRVIRKISNREFLKRGVTYVGRWASHVTKYYIAPRTPFLTGELRGSLDDRTRATPAGNISIVWYARAPHAPYLEDEKQYGRHIAAIRNFTTPGTEAPFMLPNIKKAMPVIRKAMAEMFGGK